MDLRQIFEYFRDSNLTWPTLSALSLVAIFLGRNNYTKNSNPKKKKKTVKIENLPVKHKPPTKFLRSESIREFDESANGAHEIDAFIESIISVCYDALSCEKLFLMLFKREKKKMVVIATKGVGDVEAEALKEVSDYVMKNNHLIRIDDFQTDKRFASHLSSHIAGGQAGLSLKTVLSAPVCMRTGRIIGVFSAINKITDEDDVSKFNSSDETIIQIVAANAGIAMERIKQYNEAIRAHRKSSALLSIVRARTSEQTLENILQVTVNAAYDLLLPERVTVYLCDHRKEEAWICVTKDEMEGLTVRFGEGVAGTVAASGKTVRIEDANNDARYIRETDSDTGFQTKSVLCAAVPGFGADSKPIAVVQLINKVDGKSFDEDDEEALEEFCEEVSLAFRRKMLEVNLLKVARTLRQDATPERYSTAKLEESLLQEYSSVVQRNRYSVGKSTPSSEHLDLSDAIAEQFDVTRREVNGGRARSDTNMTRTIYSVIHRWDVDPFEISESDLMVYVEQMFVYYQLIETYKISVPKLRSFIMAVHANYPTTNAFHNFRHGWSVLHMTYQILRHGAAQYLTTLEIFAALIGSFCHDLDHPGHSNAFEIASSGPLSLIYGDDAVLERHHTAETLRLLRVPENNILEGLTHGQHLEMRRLLNSAILATDMTQHFVHVEQLVARGKKTPPIDTNDSTDRRLLIGNILHCADLSGQAMPFSVANKWSDACLMEFQHQARKENELNLPPTPFMQGLESELKCMQLQYGFVTNIVLPLWKALAETLPEVKILVENASKMKEYYNSRMEELTVQDMPHNYNQNLANAVKEPEVPDADVLDPPQPPLENHVEAMHI